MTRALTRKARVLLRVLAALGVLLEALSVRMAEALVGVVPRALAGLMQELSDTIILWAVYIHLTVPHRRSIFIYTKYTNPRSLLSNSQGKLLT